MEPLGVAHNIIERLDVKDKNILVIGCGPVGLLAVAVARALGAKHITAVDMFEHKLNIARRLGATDTIDAAKSDLKDEAMRITQGNGFDRVCEASGMKMHIPSNQGLSLIARSRSDYKIGFLDARVCL